MTDTSKPRTWRLYRRFGEPFNVEGPDDEREHIVVEKAAYDAAETALAERTRERDDYATLARGRLQEHELRKAERNELRAALAEAVELLRKARTNTRALLSWAEGADENDELGPAAAEFVERMAKPILAAQGKL